MACWRRLLPTCDVVARHQQHVEQDGGADGAAGRRNNGVTVDDSVLDLLEGDGRFDLGVALVVVVHVWLRPCAPPWNSGGPLKAAYDLIPPPTEMTIKVLRRIC